MIEPEKLLGRIYDAFNRRDIDTVLAAMHPAVDWPNGMGGRPRGRTRRSTLLLESPMGPQSIPL